MQRKSEIAERRYFPNVRKRPVLFDDYRRALAPAGKAIMRTDAGYRRALDAFVGRRAETITAREVESWREGMWLSTVKFLFEMGLHQISWSPLPWRTKRQAAPLSSLFSSGAKP